MTETTQVPSLLWYMLVKTTLESKHHQLVDIPCLPIIISLKNHVSALSMLLFGLIHHMGLSLIRHVHWKIIVSRGMNSLSARQQHVNHSFLNPLLFFNLLVFLDPLPFLNPLFFLNPLIFLNPLVFLDSLVFLNPLIFIIPFYFLIHLIF